MLAVEDGCRKGPTGRCSPWEISFAVPWCFFPLSVEDGYSSTSLQNQASLGSGCCNLSLLKPCISPWNWGGPHLSLSFGAGRFGRGKGQTCSTHTSCTTCCGQIQGLAFNQTSFWRHVLLFLLFVSFVGSKSAFICWELKGTVLMWSRRDFLLWRQSSRLLLGSSWLQAGCAWPGVRCCWSVPMPAEAPKGALDTRTNSLYKALALI